MEAFYVKFYVKVSAFYGKAETSCNIRLNNHRKVGSNVDAKITCKHFQQESHNFNKHAKFNILD